MISKRLRRILIDVSVLLNQFAGLDGTLLPHLQINNLPADIEVVGIQLDPAHPTTAHVYVYSSTFSPVDDGEATPFLHLEVSRWLCPEMLKQQGLD